jgi:hypothetical protein
MTVGRLKTHDAYVWGVVEQLCTEIRAKSRRRPLTSVRILRREAP